jgi:glyoxylase-like metal-dependent hydrolase (beta-lactamase superfamily II)
MSYPLTPTLSRGEREKNALLVLAVLALAAGGVADTLESARRARQVLEQGAAALGGMEALRSAGAVAVRYEGETIHRNQSRRPEPPYERTPIHGTLALDLRTGRFSHEVESSFPGGFHSRTRFITDGKQTWNLLLSENRAFGFGPPTPAQLRNFQRWFPHLVVANALEHAAQSRFAGEGTEGGRPQDMVEYPNDDGNLMTLSFDKTTHLLTKFERVATDPVSGDATLERIFPGYREIQGLKFPDGRVTRRAGELVEELRFVDVQRAGTIPDSVFALPAGFQASPFPPAPAPPLVKLGEGVYLHRAAYNTLFVELGDFLLAVEAPGNDAASTTAIARLREAVPDKPIRYLAVTHHHEDHAGGARAYIAEGAVLVTTPGNRSFFEKMAKAPFTIEPDHLARQPRPAVIETVTGGKRVFTGGGHSVELYDIGTNPHTDEMLVAWLPKERILFEGDLFNRPADGHALAGNETTVAFARWLEKSGLDVKTIVPVHGPVATMEDLRQAVALFEKAKP